jgi:hypothetical protein
MRCNRCPNITPSSKGQDGRLQLKNVILHMSEFQINAVIRTVMTGKLVEYLATARIGERGTLTLPKDFRDALNLQTGAALTMLRIGNGLMLIPEQKRFDELWALP